MQTELAKKLGIEFPIFAFTHCRDVVAAVTNAGGIGVLGATGFTPEKLQIELDWIDDKVGDRPYGVDVIIPRRFEGRGEKNLEKQRRQVRAAIPDHYYDFARKLLDEVPDIDAPKVARIRLQYETGVYKIDGGQIAERMMREMSLNDKLH